MSDPFFDSLREDYLGFDDWFISKSEQDVFVRCLKLRTSNMETLLFCIELLKIIKKQNIRQLRLQYV